MHPCSQHCSKQRFRAFGLSLSSMRDCRPVYKVERIHKSEYIQRDRVWEGFAEWKYFLHGSRQLIGFVSTNSPASSTGSSMRPRGTGDCAACKLAQYRLPRTEYEHIIITSGLSYAAAGHERWIGVCYCVLCLAKS